MTPKVKEQILKRLGFDQKTAKLSVEMLSLTNENPFELRRMKAWLEITEKAIAEVESL